jgi:hypothetical protein
MTQREAALAARIAELEAKAAARAAQGGNVIDQVWRYINYFVPRWIVGLAVLIFGCFQLLDYYQNGQREASIARLKQAQLQLKDADAVAQRLMVNGQPARVERLRAEAELKQKQAAQAKIEADALNTKVDGMTARLRAVELEVSNKQLAAKKAELEASAKWDRQPDGRTLEQDFVEAKETATELEAITSKWTATLSNGESKLDALCMNRFAKLLDCPGWYHQYVRQ